MPLGLLAPGLQREEGEDLKCGGGGSIKFSKPPPEGQRAEQGQLPAAAEITLQPSRYGEMMVLGEQHLQTNYGRVFSAGPASASRAQPRAAGGPGGRETGSILNSLPGLRTRSFVSGWEEEAGPTLRSRASLKRAADGRAGSCPAPTGSRWLLPAARTGRAGERSRLRPAFGFFPPACPLRVKARGADAAWRSSSVPAGESGWGSGQRVCSSASVEVEAE